MKNLGSFLAMFVLLHAVVTNPLLVQCIQADGLSLLEILGHDPCHDANAGIGTVQGFRSPALTGMKDQTDPCLDLLLDDSGDIQICSDFITPPPQAPAPAACILNDSVEASLADDFRKPGPVTPLRFGDVARSQLILRI